MSNLQDLFDLVMLAIVVGAFAGAAFTLVHRATEKLFNDLD